jgi:hypothetical protein
MGWVLLCHWVMLCDLHGYVQNIDLECLGFESKVLTGCCLVYGRFYVARCCLSAENKRGGNLAPDGHVHPRC